MHEVMMITGWVGDQFGRLRFADHVAGARHDRLLAFDLKGEAPGTEGIAPKIRTERGGNPALAAVAGDFHRADTIAAIPGDATEQAASFEFGAVTVAGNERVHHHFRNRRDGCRILRGDARPQWKLAERNPVA